MTSHSLEISESLNDGCNVSNGFVADGVERSTSRGLQTRNKRIADEARWEPSLYPSQADIENATILCEASQVFRECTKKRWKLGGDRQRFQQYHEDRYCEKFDDGNYAANQSVYREDRSLYQGGYGKEDDYADWDQQYPEVRCVRVPASWTTPDVDPPVDPSRRIVLTRGQHQSGQTDSYGSVYVQPPYAEKKAPTRELPQPGSYHATPGMEIEIAPGVVLPLRGSEETWQALQAGRSENTVCVFCSLELNCIKGAEFVLCPDCKIVSPVEGSTGKGGVGLGVKSSIMNQWRIEI